MADPVVERIAQNIKTTIEQLSIANGYDIDVSVQRPELSDFSDIAPADGIVLLAQDKIAFSPPAGPVQPQKVQFTAEVYVQPKNDGTKLDTLINRRVIDVINELLEDPQRSTLAQDTIITDLTLGHTTDGYSGGTLEFEVSFKTKFDDYTVKM